MDDDSEEDEVEEDWLRQGWRSETGIFKETRQ